MIPKFYFSTTAYTDEISALTEVKPKRLLFSYFYFRNKRLIDVFNRLGYTPELMLDSGAYSAFTRGKNISIVDYMNYIKANAEQINHYITLDVIGDPYITRRYYEIMLAKGFNPIPVFHYGDDFKTLDEYVNYGAGYIAIGNTVPIKDKKKVAEYVSKVVSRHPGVKFHLLGSSAEPVLGINGLYSCDSSTWIIQAKNGKPKHIKGNGQPAKIRRAVFNLREIERRCS